MHSIIQVGPLNKVGPQGPEGKQGEQGLPGIDGTRGSLWFSGTEYPDNALEQDLFFNTKTQDLYQLIDSNWTFLANLKGDTGKKGKDGKNGKDGKDGKNATYPGFFGVQGTSGGGSGVATQAPKLIDTFDTAPETSVGDLVYLSSTDFVTKISDNTFSTIPNGIFGVVFAKPTSVRADVLFAGIMSGYSGFTPSLPLFVSTTGVPTHTPPLTGVVQQIGFATRSTSFMVQLMLPTVRSA